eukprot:Clim_evm18s202 gene=Clim_evmTU18s202
MPLSDRARTELLGAIHGFLTSQGLVATAAELEIETQSAFTTNGDADMLEKKWNAVVRLQRKVLDLEQEVEDLRRGGALKKPTGSGDRHLLPRAPATHVLKGHRGPITTVSFHPIWSLLFSASEDAAIRVWDPITGKCEQQLRSHTETVQDVAFNTEGTLMASCSADFTVKLWDMESFEMIRTLHGHDHNVTGVRFARNDQSLISCSRDSTIKIWNVETGYCQTTLHGHDDWVRKIDVYDPDKLIASCSSDNTVRVWSYESTQCLHELRGHSHVVECVAFCPHETLVTLNPMLRKDASADDVVPILASGGRDRTIRLWRLDTGDCMQTLHHDGWVRSVTFADNGRYLLSTGDDKQLKVWDLPAERCVKSLEASLQFVSNVSCDNSGTLVATGSADGAVSIWECT